MKGAIASTHNLATQAGADILAKGGNAFDAAVAAGLVLQVVEPHLNGPGGDLPAILWKDGKAQILCAQAPAPAGATLEHYRNEGLELIPGDGLLATVIPGAFDGWMLMLRDHGTMELADIMAPAIKLADEGHPILDRAVDTITGLADFFRNHWKGSADLWLPDGKPPVKGGLFYNHELAATWRRLINEAQGDSRNARIDAARDIFYRGFIAERIAEFCAETEAMDASGRTHRGVLSAQDMAGYSASYEEPLTFQYKGWTVAKTNVWGQGPVLLQTLSLLDGYDLSSLDPLGSAFAHLVLEAQKLAFADRDTYYGDSSDIKAPIQVMLDNNYVEKRRQLISEQADNRLNPGTPEGFETTRERMLDLFDRLSSFDGAVYEPTMAHLRRTPSGDTVHLDVIDRWGNMVSATPSGGWLQSSPTIPGLGFCLNSRAQMYWLEDGLPSSLVPGRRPRTTLSPSLAWHEDGRRLSFGTPGGDQQDQWQLLFFLRFLHGNMDLQKALDAPMYHSTHMPSSFYPRSREPGGVVAEADLPDATIDDLKERGHHVKVVPAGSIGRVSAALYHPDNKLEAAITRRGTYGGAIVLE
ncbi:gamma-glutamyltransferase family protein [Brucellaceae bacterium C25G]